MNPGRIYTPKHQVIKRDDGTGNYSWIPGSLSGKDVFIVCSGPSMKDFDYNLLKGKTVIAINSEFFFVPNCEWLVCSDHQFISGEENIKKEEIIPSKLKCKIICSPNARLKPGENVAVVRKVPTWSLDLEFGVMGTNSGAFAITLAVIAEANRIFVLGMDGEYIKGNRHHYDNVWTYDRCNDPKKALHWTQKIDQHYSHLKNVYNLSPISRIKAFRKASYEFAGLK